MVRRQGHTSPKPPPRLLLLLQLLPRILGAPASVAGQIPEKRSQHVFLAKGIASGKMMICISVAILQHVWPVVIASRLNVNVRFLAQDHELASAFVVGKCLA